MLMLIYKLVWERVILYSSLKQLLVPEMSADSSESILRASKTSKSVLFTWMTLLTVPVLAVMTAWERSSKKKRRDIFDNRKRKEKKRKLVTSVLSKKKEKYKFALTPVGSNVHCPSTQNLYWCSPSGRSTIATKFFWLLERRPRVTFVIGGRSSSMSCVVWGIPHESNVPFVKRDLGGPVVKRARHKDFFRAPRPSEHGRPGGLCWALAVRLQILLPGQKLLYFLRSLVIQEDINVLLLC